MHRILALAVLVLVPCLAGCRHYHSYVYHDDCYVPGRVVHVHGPDCGHVIVDNCWLEPRVVHVEESWSYCAPRVVISPPVPVIPSFWGWGPHFGPSIEIHRSRHCR